MKTQERTTKTGNVSTRYVCSCGNPLTKWKKRGSTPPGILVLGEYIQCCKCDLKLLIPAWRSLLESKVKIWKD